MIEDINTISEKYRKYLCSIKLDSKKYYFIAGTDLNYDLEDKLLLDKYSKLLLMNSVDILFKINLYTEVVVFDNENFNLWFDNIKLFLEKNNHEDYTYALYDLDLIHKIYIFESLYQVQYLSREKIKEFVDFINLVNDYAIQSGNQELKSLIQSNSVQILWETYYDIEFWKKDKVGTFENLITNFNEIEFKINLAKIYAYFISCFHFIK